MQIIGNILSKIGTYKTSMLGVVGLSLKTRSCYMQIWATLTGKSLKAAVLLYTQDVTPQSTWPWWPTSIIPLPIFY